RGIGGHGHQFRGRVFSNLRAMSERPGGREREPGPSGRGRGEETRRGPGGRRRTASQPDRRGERRRNASEPERPAAKPQEREAMTSEVDTRPGATAYRAPEPPPSEPSVPLPPDAPR